jgi:hypothetical protein
MKKSQILFCAEESERTGGLTFIDEILSGARRLREKKMDWKSSFGCEELWTIVMKSKKQTAHFSAADLISVPRESAECVPRT